MNMRQLCAGILLLVLLVPVQTAHAVMLSFLSDLINTSTPSAFATHIIQFTSTRAIPPSGKFVITPAPGAFTILGSFDYEDVDVAVATSGPYVDRTVAATPGAGADGVSVASGQFGSFTVTLNSTTGIAAGDRVQVELGSVATYGATGTGGIYNPSSPGSYHIRIKSYDASNVLIDEGSTLIAVILPVGVVVTPVAQAPIRSNGLPSGSIAAGSGWVELSLQTDELAHCRYATSSGVSYGSMTNSFSPATGQTFYTNVSGHVDGQTYTYYVRCMDLQNLANNDDYAISFTLDATPSTDTSIVTGYTTNGSGGVGPYPNGSATMYQASVSLSGWAMPGGLVTILKDGVTIGTVTARTDGYFTTSLSNLERGTYTFQLYAQDSQGRRTSSFTATLTLDAGTTNSLTNILIPPSAAFVPDSVAVGESVRIEGESVPGSRIEVPLRQTLEDGRYGDPVLYSATTTGFGIAGTAAGRWSIAVPARDLARGTYVARARAIRSAEVESPYGKTIGLGVGQGAPSDLFLRADLNKDGKVNLVDFSILLSFWATDDSEADINEDGTVGLPDFSIMLFQWTG